METTVLTSAQKMISESFASAKSQEEIDDLMDDMLRKRLDKELDRLWDEGILNQEKLDELRYQHLRTPYRPL